MQGWKLRLWRKAGYLELIDQVFKGGRWRCAMTATERRASIKSLPDLSFIRADEDLDH